MIKRGIAAALILLAADVAALAQTSPNLITGQVLTAAQWNALFIAKQDTLGYIPLNTAGGVMTGRLVTTSPGATLASFNLPQGNDPGSPANGDMWMKSTGLFIRVNGVTVGPLAGATASSFSATSPLAVTFPAGVVNYAFNFSIANTWLAQQTAQGLTTTQPGWFVQINGDSVPRVHLGANTTDVPALSFGSGSATRDAFIQRVGAANLRLGASDAAAPVAQTLGVQNVLTGTSNTAGANLTISGSQGTGTGLGGSIIFQTSPAGGSGSTLNALSNAMTILGSGATAIKSPAVQALAVGLNGATNPAFQVDASTASQVAGLSVKGAVTGGTVALAAIDSGTNANISLNAKGNGIITIGNSSTGATQIGAGGGGLTVTSSFTAIGLVTNADLTSPSITVNGSTCTLGASCSPVSASTGSFESISFNAGGSGQTTTGTISASSTSLAIASALDFINGEGVRVNHAGPAFLPGAPSSLVVTPTGTAGATTYVYTIASLDAIGGVGIAIGNITTTTGNATLSSTNYNALTWTAGSGSPWGYAVYVSCPSCTQHTSTATLIAITQTNSYNDFGFNLITPAPDWLPVAPQVSALASWLVTTVSSGGGTTTLTLGNAATTAATTQLIDHDDTVALQACITAALNAKTRCHLSGLSGVSFPTTSPLQANGRVEIFGDGIQGTQNYNYANQGSVWLTRASSGNATTIFPNITQPGLTIVSNDAVNIHDFGIVYTTNPPQLGAVTALSITGTGGAYTITQTGTLNGTTTITGLTDTRYMHVNQGLFGTNIPAGTTVTSIDSATQIHISAAATGSGATSLTFDVITGDTLNGTLNGTTGVTSMTNANFILAGEVITGTCIPFGTVVAASTSTTVTMSKAATCSTTTPLTFAFGIMTNMSLRGMLLSGADRLLFLGNMTEFWVEKNKLYDAISYSAILDLNNGNGDWQWGPGNIAISGSIYPLVHKWHMSGGGGREFGNKYNTGGSVNVNGAGGTIGIDFNAVRDFTSFEPPTITGNSIEGLGIGIRAFNSCPHTTTCQGSQFSITGNQMWNNRDIEFDGLFSGGTISTNSMNVNGGGGTINMVLSNVSNIVWNDNVFGNTTGTGSTAISLSSCTNCSGSGNKKINNTTLGNTTFTAPACGVASVNNSGNMLELSGAGGTGVTLVTRGGTSVFGQASNPMPPIDFIVNPGDSVIVTCTTPPGFNVFAVNP